MRRINLKVDHAILRDVVVAYWARLTALQKGLEIDKSSAEALATLLPLMEWLESQKKVDNCIALLSWESFFFFKGAQGE